MTPRLESAPGWFGAASSTCWYSPSAASRSPAWCRFTARANASSTVLTAASWGEYCVPGTEYTVRGTGERRNPAGGRVLADGRARPGSLPDVREQAHEPGPLDGRAGGPLVGGAQPAPLAAEQLP